MHHSGSVQSFHTAMSVAITGQCMDVDKHLTAEILMKQSGICGCTVFQNFVTCLKNTQGLLPSGCQCHLNVEQFHCERGVMLYQQNVGEGLWTGTQMTVFKMLWSNYIENICEKMFRLWSWWSFWHMMSMILLDVILCNSGEASRADWKFLHSMW
jgi:hypothetical protein